VRRVNTFRRRRYRHILDSLLIVVLLTARPRSPYGGQPAGPVLNIPHLGSGGLLLFGNGAVLAWSADAHIRIRSPAGAWGSVLSLPATALDDGISSQDDVLVLGERSQEFGRPIVATIFRLDSSGRITDRWELPNMPVNSLASTRGQLWASTAIGIVELRPGGVVEKIREAESWAILVTRKSDTPVICVPADLSKAHFAPSYCYAIDGKKWRIQTAWTRPPIVCADFLIEVGASQVTVRLANTGEVASRCPLTAETAIACGQGAELLLSGREVTALSLPNLEPRWTSPLKRGRVTALIRAGDGVVAFTERGPVDLSIRPK
jgi:hypothetical protein